VDGEVGGAAMRLVGVAGRLGEARTGNDSSDLVSAKGGSDTLPGQRIEDWKWLSARLTGEVMGDYATSGVELNAKTTSPAGADSEDRR
jgi:hypothetical protein